MSPTSPGLWQAPAMVPKEMRRTVAPYFWGHMAQATTRLALAYMMVWSQAMKLGSHFTIIRILHCPLEKEMACQALQYLAWEIPRTKEPGRLQSMGSQRGRCDETTTTTTRWETAGNAGLAKKMGLRLQGVWGGRQCGWGGPSEVCLISMALVSLQTGLCPHFLLRPRCRAASTHHSPLQTQTLLLGGTLCWLCSGSVSFHPIPCLKQHPELEI